MGREGSTVVNFKWHIPGRLATGGKPSCVEQIEWLREQGIQAIVSLVLIPEAVVSKIESAGINYLSMPISDYDDVMYDPYAWGEFSRFIHANIHSGKAVFVHCNAGYRRSVRLVEKYIVKREE